MLHGIPFLATWKKLPAIKKRVQATWKMLPAARNRDIPATRK
jgi:hypothetical protein